MKIEFNSCFDFTLKITSQHKDIAYAEMPGITILIYGFPFIPDKKQWLTPKTAESLYKKSDVAFIDSLDGFYTIIIYDEKGRKFFVITDRYGIYTFFYKKEKDRILISNKISSLMNSDIKLDAGRIFEFLNIGYKIGNKTHIRDIFEFEGGKIYEISSDLDFTEKEYWNLFDKDKGQLTQGELRDIYNDNVQTAFSLEENISLPLTGGRDTRAILSACLDNLSNLHCYTFGPANHSDYLTANRICKHFNIDYDFVELSPEWAKQIPGKLPKYSHLFNGLSDFNLIYTQDLESFEREQKRSTMYLTGVSGNQLFRHHPFGNKAPKSMRIDECSHFILENLPSVLFFKTDLTGFYKNFFKGYSIEDICKLIVDNIGRNISKAHNAAKPIDLTSYFLFKNYCGNHISNCLKAAGHYLKVFSPFYQKDILPRVRYFDLSERTKGEFHQYLISSNNKYLGNQAFSNSGRRIKYAKLISNLIFTQLVNIPIFPDPTVSSYPVWLKKYHEAFVNKTLNYETMYLQELIEKEALETLKHYYFNKRTIKGKKDLLLTFSVQRMIIHLISLELWFKTVR